MWAGEVFEFDVTRDGRDQAVGLVRVAAPPLRVPRLVARFHIITFCVITPRATRRMFRVTQRVRKGMDVPVTRDLSDYRTS